MVTQSRKIKKLLVLFGITCLSLVLVASFLLTACAQPAPAPAPAPAAKPAAAPVRLTWGNAWTEYFNALYEDMGKRVEQRTNNAVKFDYFWGGSLVTPGEERKFVSEGTIDLTHLHPIYYPDMTMSNWTWAMPFNPTDNAIMVKLIYDVFKAFPDMQKEIAKSPVHVIGQWASAPYDFNAKFALNKIDDMKGKKIIGLGKYEPQWYQTAGATPVTVPSPDRFNALMTGMADGGTGQVAYFLSYKFYDAGSPYITYIGLGARTGNGYYVMNQKKWDSLPANVQKVITEEWERFAFETAPTTVKNMVDKWRADAEKAGFKIGTLSDDQKLEWAKRIEPIVKGYAADIDKDKSQTKLGAKLIKYIQDKQKELGAPVFYQFKVD